MPCAKALATAERPINASVYLITSDGKTLRLPIPSPSSKDPLNWSWVKRYGMLISISLVTTIGLVLIQGTRMLLESLEGEYTAEEMKPFALSTIASSGLLFAALGGFLWIPLCMAIGRRPVLLLCALMQMLGIGVAAMSRTFYVHLVGRALVGLGLGFSSTAVVLLILDLTFIHQRPIVIAFYWSLACVTSNVVQIPTAMLIHSWKTWRPFYYVWMGPAMLSVLLVFLFCPETHFERPAVAFDGHVLVQSESERVKLYQGWDEVPGGKALPDTPEAKWKTLAKNLLFWRKLEHGGWTTILRCYREVLYCLLNPLIFWVAVLNALVFTALGALDETDADLLSSAQYNFSLSKTFTLLFTASAVASTLGAPAAGFLTSWTCKRLAARNRGVREPEHYLPAFILPVLATAIGLALYGVAGTQNWDRAWIFVFVAAIHFGYNTLFTASILWVTEAFPQWQAPALVVVGGIGFFISWLLELSLRAWRAAVGFELANIELGVLIFAVGCLGIPMAIWGKQGREYIYSLCGASGDTASIYSQESDDGKCFA